MSKVSFHVLYDGDALQNSEMNVQDLAPALLALGTLLEEANTLLNGSKSKITVSVKASFKTGCFGIDLETSLSILQQLNSLFDHDGVKTAKEIIEWLGLVVAPPVYGLFEFIKWVKGRRISKVKILENGLCTVYIDKEHINVEQQIIDLYQSKKIRDAFAKVLSPLENEGINEFAIIDASQTRISTVNREERHYFDPPIAEPQELETTELEINLQLINISFQDDNKWRFSDGNSTFYAEILDDNFLQKVQTSEVSFAKGDLLKARVTRHQFMLDDKIKLEYQVLKVLNHQKSPLQLSLPIERE